MRVFYHFEIQMTGVILLTAMAAGGISLWLKKRREADCQDEGRSPAGRDAESA